MVPTLISVSIDAEPCLRLVQVALWKPQPHQNSTGVAATRLAHCQPGNCSGVTIATTITGTEMIAATIRRRLMESASALASSSESVSGVGRDAS